MTDSHHNRVGSVTGSFSERSLNTLVVCMVLAEILNDLAELTLFYVNRTTPNCINQSEFNILKLGYVQEKNFGF